MNKKVMAMFEKAEDEYNDLMSKKNIIEVVYPNIQLALYLSFSILVLILCLPE